MSPQQKQRSDQPHFVWWRGAHNRPEPQKWHTGLDYGVSAWKLPRVIAAYPLTPEQATWPLDCLAVRFPVPKTDEDKAADKAATSKEAAA